MHHTTRSYIIPIGLSTILSFAAFGSVLWSIDPFTTSWIGHLFFYLTLFLSLAGLFTFVGVLFRKKFAPGMFTEQLRISIRQGILLALLMIGLLLFQVFNVLFWWVGLTFILFIITVEIFLNV
jgi:hypothetical protein